MAHTFTNVAALLLLVVGIGACDSKNDRNGSGDGTSAIDTATLAPPLPKGSSVDTTAAIDTNMRELLVTHRATISTSMGDIEIELYGKDAPKTVKNFAELAKKKYYDSVAFHRVIPGYMVQTGDPNSKDASMREMWGAGGKSIYGDTFEDELDSSTTSARRGYVAGTVAMANAGPNTNGSQFFIVASTAGARHLTFNYTIFGMVTKGMDVVKKIEETGNQGEKPVDPARIKSVTVTELPTPEKSTTATAAM